MIVDFDDLQIHISIELLFCPELEAFGKARKNVCMTIMSKYGNVKQK